MKNQETNTDVRRILFIYGYGGSPESTFCSLLRKHLPQEQYEVICYSYSQQDCSKAVDELDAIVEREQIDIVVGTSLGGFLTLSLDTDCPKVVLNPCMRPTQVLPLLKPRPNHPEDVEPSAEMIATYAPFEEKLFRKDHRGNGQLIGLFATDDELLGTQFKDVFRKQFGEVWSMPGGHHGNEQAIPTIVQAINSLYRPILYFDMDNVLVDFKSGIEKLDEATKAKYKGHYDDAPGIFALMGPAEGAIDAVHRLSKRYDCFILSTSPWDNATAWSDKLKWVKNHLGDTMRKKLILSHHKGLCRAVPGRECYLIDDRTKHGARQFGEHHIHLGSGRFPNWDSVVAELETKAPLLPI